MKAMTKKDLGELTMRFIDGLDANDYDEGTVFDNAIITVAFRKPDGETGVAFLTAEGATYANVGLLSETIRIERNGGRS